MQNKTIGSESVLVPVTEQSVRFCGSEITMAVVQMEEHIRMYIPLRPICTSLGLSWSGQREHIYRDPVLSEEVRVVRFTTLGGSLEVLCLPLEYLSGWLFGVNATRVKPELRDKVIRYQRECYRILWQAFQQEARPVVETPSVALAALQQIRNMGLAIAQMAEQQMEMEQRLTTRLDRAARVVGDLQRRLGAVEMKLHPQTLVTDEQAEEISAAVKALAELITTREPKKNHYQGIFAELYRRFGVSSYKNIRLSQYEQVLRFLEDWRTTVSEGGQGPAER